MLFNYAKQIRVLQIFAKIKNRIYIIKVYLVINFLMALNSIMVRYNNISKFRKLC